MQIQIYLYHSWQEAANIFSSLSHSPVLNLETEQVRREKNSWFSRGLDKVLHDVGRAGKRGRKSLCLVLPCITWKRIKGSFAGFGGRRGFFHFLSFFPGKDQVTWFCFTFSNRQTENRQTKKNPPTNTTCSMQLLAWLWSLDSEPKQML